MRPVWKFLSSVKLAIVLIILLAVASVIGTLIPQGRGVAEYTARYGNSLASLFDALRFTRLFRSDWFLAILMLLAANTIVCTVTRFGPKWRRVFRPAPEADVKAVLSRRSSCRFRLPLVLDEARAAVEKELRGRHYVLSRSGHEGKVVLEGRKRRLGWFGSDIVHVGLLVILAGGFTSGLVSRRAELSLSEGQTAAVPHAPFELRLDKFETEYYPQGGVKDWKSTVTIVAGGAPAVTRTIEVNKPLTYHGVSFYQQGYGYNWEKARIVLEVRKPGSSAAAPLTVGLRPGERVPVESPDITQVSVRSFVPDFVIGEGNQVQSRSEEPNNPAALVEAWKGEEKVFSSWIFSKFPDFGQGHGAGAPAAKTPPVAIILKDYQAAAYSVLESAQDPGATVIWVGCALISLGLFLAFYWPPREIRVVLEASQGRVELAAGGQAAKGRESFQAEFDAIFGSIRRPE